MYSTCHYISMYESHYGRFWNSARKSFSKTTNGTPNDVICHGKIAPDAPSRGPDKWNLCSSAFMLFCWLVGAQGLQRLSRFCYFQCYSVVRFITAEEVKQVDCLIQWNLLAGTSLKRMNLGVW